MANENQLITSGGSRIPYDVLSINTGSTQSKVIDAPDCISIKPVGSFLTWLTSSLPEQLESQKSHHLMIIGAGAAGVEVALAIKKRFNSNPALIIHIITASGVLAGHPHKIRALMEEELSCKNIILHSQFRVADVQEKTLISQSGERLNYDSLILATPASPAGWPSESSLATSHSGFIRVNNTLQSVSHPNVFACGDIAELIDTSIAKCGVYAVRQAPVLYKNLDAYLSGTTLTPYIPQKQFLSLLSCADGQAIASRGRFRAKGSTVWLWKDWIDRRFMAQFPLPESGSMIPPGS
jgi:selenide,water dikinase